MIVMIYLALKPLLTQRTKSSVQRVAMDLIVISANCKPLEPLKKEDRLDILVWVTPFHSQTAPSIAAIAGFGEAGVPSHAIAPRRRVDGRGVAGHWDRFPDNKTAHLTDDHIICTDPLGFGHSRRSTGKLDNGLSRQSIGPCGQSMDVGCHEE